MTELTEQSVRNSMKDHESKYWFIKEIFVSGKMNKFKNIIWKEIYLCEILNLINDKKVVEFKILCECYCPTLSKIPENYWISLLKSKDSRDWYMLSSLIKIIPKSEQIVKQIHEIVSTSRLFELLKIGIDPVPVLKYFNYPWKEVVQKSIVQPFTPELFPLKTIIDSDFPRVKKWARLSCEIETFVNY